MGFLREQMGEEELRHLLEMLSVEAGAYIQGATACHCADSESLCSPACALRVLFVPLCCSQPASADAALGSSLPACLPAAGPCLCHSHHALLPGLQARMAASM